MRQNLPMILIRMIVGLVFLLEGVLKFLRPEELGAGRFAAIGLPFPHQLATLVGSIEIGGGVAVLLNFYAGDAALALLAVIVTALITTKFPILLGRPLGPFSLEKLFSPGAHRPVHGLRPAGHRHRLRCAGRTQETLVSIQEFLKHG
jgi:hypothetical protein